MPISAPPPCSALGAIADLGAHVGHAIIIPLLSDAYEAECAIAISLILLPLLGAISLLMLRWRHSRALVDAAHAAALPLPPMCASGGSEGGTSIQMEPLQTEPQEAKPRPH